jgi:phosphohistidine phosphatase
MDLILWRHAEAEQGGRDASRALTKKGEKQASQVASWLKRRLPRGASILVSPARRAQQTAKALTAKYRTVAALDVGASGQDVLAAAGWPDGKGAVVIVGHQPTLGQAAAMALVGADADWNIKKGAVWWLAQRKRDKGTIVRAVISPELL